ncbi:MAG: hypothetical protein JW841_14650 [Deltaproteobacteria bacterium]|nr:hypothetical protein [Deltaproteobacteria bacterium]
MNKKCRDFYNSCLNGCPQLKTIDESSYSKSYNTDNNPQGDTETPACIHRCNQRIKNCK